MPEQRFAALGDFVRSVREWSSLVRRRRIGSPKRLVGARLRFGDGTSPVVFRETASREASTTGPAVLVIQFRLAFLGSNPYLHAAFRRECILHTPLFAGFPGFRSKLWADDVETGVYAGLYEWEGARLATHYAERMVALLAPFSNPGTARFHVIDGFRRDDFLSAPSAADEHSMSDWWRIVDALPEFRAART